MKKEIYECDNCQEYLKSSETPLILYGLTKIKFGERILCLDFGERELTFCSGSCLGDYLGEKFTDLTEEKSK